MTNARIHPPYEGEGLEGFLDPCTSLEDAVRAAKKSIRPLGFKFKKHYSYGIYGVNLDGYYICKTYVPFLFSQIVGDLNFGYKGIPWPWVSQHPSSWHVEVYGKKELVPTFQDIFLPIAEKNGYKLDLRHTPKKKYRTPVHSIFDFIEYIGECGDAAEAH